MKYKNIREEELKNKVAADWFKAFDATEIIGNIDFTVFPKQAELFGRTPLLWAEAKTGDYNISTMFVQLILTIGKARTFDKTLPPAFLGAFDFKKIAFVPYISVQDIFYINDFNWNVAPSNHETKEFKLIKERIESTLNKNSYVYDYINDENELRIFIANNIAKATEASKIKIDKNNFTPIYLRWLDFVKPIIDVNWDELRNASILDSDFYLADLFVDDKDTNKIEDDITIRENLFVIYENQGYKIAKENLRQMFDATIGIRNKEIYRQFWKRYKRPPLREFQEYIIERRDLLVPQDIRERKGAFFTPRIWVELSQKYITDYLGQNWQDEYYVWDCAAGTGNLLAGLTNKYNIWASTLDQADVKVMHDRIQHGANLLENHVFQFDFLNDDFSKLPQGLQDIINNEDKRKKLIIYINPPYAEAGSIDNVIGTGTNKTDVAVTTKVYAEYQQRIGIAGRELFAQFLARIFDKFPTAILAQFSKLKVVQGPNFQKFRDFFKVEFQKGFAVPASTFDNVKGRFPVAFMIWKLNDEKRVENVSLDIFDSKENLIALKTFFAYDKSLFITDWLRKYHIRIISDKNLGALSLYGSDFQHSNFIQITNPDQHPNRWTFITENNLIECSIYLSVRHCIDATWLNDRDQFLYPNDNWQTDLEFQNDCLAFTLFDGSNNIQSKFGVNNWIPFTESEVNAGEKFESNFMTDFIKGKIKAEKQSAGLLFAEEIVTENKPKEFSNEATEVFNTGRELWRYYHSQANINVNASLYDIREYFQGRNAQGRMNPRSNDEKYTALIGNVRQKINLLAAKIAPKVYEYEFLKQ